MMEIFDDTRCALGEGPLWHPERRQLFWFDILGGRLLTREGDERRQWQFDGPVSAAGWVDRDTLLIASDEALLRFDIATGQSGQICPLEADNPVTRSNDGRADPQGGFWIGTMGRNAEEGAGAIYRYWRGELRRLFAPITISNAICFAPGGERAYFADTPTYRIMTVALDADGWPTGDPAVFVDLSEARRRPDGAVIDAEGNLWNAQYGAGCVACYAPDGRLLSRIELPASQATCPAFGGPDLRTLFCTSAAKGLPPREGGADGMTFRLADAGIGLPEHQVIL